MKENHGVLPCPFCGKRNWAFFRLSGTHATAVECRACGARGPLGIPSEEDARAAWNARKRPTP